MKRVLTILIPIVLLSCSNRTSDHTTTLSIDTTEGENEMTNAEENNKMGFDRFLSEKPHLEMFEERGTKYVKVDKQIQEEEVFELLAYLWRDGYELSFHDVIHPTISDPGAYFSYSTEKSTDPETWSMTYGNHGWSGGIYHISAKTLARQITNLIKKTDLDKIKISNVSFFSHYDIEPKEKSLEKDAEISEMHQ